MPLQVEGQEDDGYDDDTTHTLAQAEQQLLFDDLIMGQVVGTGYYNLACLVQVTDWVYQAHGLAPISELVIKLYSDATCTGRKVQAVRRVSYAYYMRKPT